MSSRAFVSNISATIEPTVGDSFFNRKPKPKRMRPSNAHRLQIAQQELRAHPASATRWQWHVRWKVLKFIVAVYGPRSGISSRDDSRSAFDTTPSRDADGTYSSIKSPAHIRALLTRITAINRAAKSAVSVSREVQPEFR